MATNDDDNVLSYIANSMMALGDNVTAVGAKVEKLEATTRAGFESVKADLTALSGDMEQVHLRLDSIERALSARMGQIETEVSRLRSAVYLLAKDRPEILRMLGPIE